MFCFIVFALLCGLIVTDMQSHCHSENRSAFSIELIFSGQFQLCVCPCYVMGILAWSNNCPVNEDGLVLCLIVFKNSLFILFYVILLK